MTRPLTSGARVWLVAALYVTIALAIYGPALSAFFLADDFYFLEIVSSARDVRVIFMPLIGRFVRPLVVLLYYACYRAVGPSPIFFHVAVLALHILNAWLIFVIGQRVLPRETGLSAFLAGLLFLVFSSHSEAVAWPAGGADPMAAIGLLSGFLAFLRARDPGSSPIWVPISVLAAASAALAKESWIVFPGFVIAYALYFRTNDPVARRRTVAVAAASLALVTFYVGARTLVFGGITDAYSGLEMKFGTIRWPREVVKFVFRCFLPAGPWILRWWPVVLVAGSVAALVVVRRARGAALHPVAFTATAMMVALAPALPLSISIVNTESERFTYAATAFSSLLIVCAATIIFRRRAAIALSCSALIVWHAVVLAADARRVHAAGMLARSLASNFAEQVRLHDPQGRAAIFLLNQPDNLAGTYVFRTGFSTAVRLVAPDSVDSLSRTDAPFTHGTASVGDRVAVRREGPDTFAFESAPNELIQRQLTDGVSYDVLSYTRTGYRVRLHNPARPTMVLFISAGRMEYAGTVEPQRHRPQ